jgi:hypothetical protein
MVSGQSVNTRSGLPDRRRVEETKEEAVTDAEVVPEGEDSGTDLQVQEDRAIATLFGSNEPSEIVGRMTEVANHLNAVIRKQDLTTKIGGKDHVQVEGWQTVGSMMGVFAVKDGPVEELPWPDPSPELIQAERSKGKVFGYRAAYRAQTLGGAVVGGGEASCSRTEAKWRAKEDHALRSMAQTRAQSKALAGALRFIVTMAGYESTPAEEMDDKEAGRTALYGPPYDVRGDAIEKLVRAMTYIFGDGSTAIELRDTLERDAGYLPKISARAILHTARLLRDKREESEPEKEEESGSSNE